MMQSQFEKFIEQKGLFCNSHNILLAVSGGVDSVVMTHLINQSGYSFGIAHCNFQLRGQESDLDETFVQDIAKKYQVDFYCKKFETLEFAEKKKISVQMAARELRYQWFEYLMKEKNYDFVAIAHHLDDQIETFLVNLIRGTGISGLHGIAPVKKKIVRPLMFALRSDIERYASQNTLPYREDSSNVETKYLRNKIRKEILPVLYEINPAYQQVFYDNIEKIKKTESIYREKIKEVFDKVVVKKMNRLFISLKSIRNLTNLSTYLYEWLSLYGFNASSVSDIINTLDEIPGKQFYSETHRLIKDRDYLVLTTKKETDNHGSNQEIDHIVRNRIYKNTDGISQPVRIKIDKYNYSEEYCISEDSMIASFDYEKLKFPLEIRRWEKGDFFYPFGMKQKKKLSDFFTDQKFSLLDKENTWILCSGGDIIWIIGHRIDNRFRLTSSTKKIFKLTILDS